MAGWGWWDSSPFGAHLTFQFQFCCWSMLLVPFGQSVGQHVHRFQRLFSNVDRSLIDQFGRNHSYLRMSLTEKCNLRCQYCMPADGVALTAREKLLNLSEKKRAIQLFSSLGVNKLRFTGGEPTVSKDLSELINFSKLECGIKSIGITTNGILLNQRLINGLVEAGLTSVNISLDTLSPQKFGEITRRDNKGLHKVLAAIYASVATGISVKVNCVLMRGTNDDEVKEFTDLTKDVNVDCRFIELMPFDGNKWESKRLLSYMEVISRLKDEGVELLPEPREGSDPHDTTKWYRRPHHMGRIGFITSMTSNFCAGCNRLRITADGKLKVCLFGEEGLSLVDSFRSGLTDAQVVELIGDAVHHKKAMLGGHASPEALAQETNRPMILIGG